ncbi:hypothetical protein BJF95_09810 [Rhizobium oryziradicis]|uniref:Uncharacterized protein n=1 Tax=Rhizobium oryziradicis TaxID=1867956 RepID=A0A1Q8ZRQ5_9HYPH|nr:hypothetical protein BJF95_09810 [Rhizobium oryziradicis]
MGLSGAPVEFDDGSMVSQMNEWGYVLFTLCTTRAIEDRTSGQSRAFDDFAGLTVRDPRDLFLKIVEMNGLEVVAIETSPHFGPSC